MADDQSLLCSWARQPDYLVKGSKALSLLLDLMWCSASSWVRLAVLLALLQLVIVLFLQHIVGLEWQHSASSALVLLHLAAVLGLKVGLAVFCVAMHSIVPFQMHRLSG